MPGQSMPVGATPPPPSGSGSAPQPSQLSHSTSYAYDDPGTGQVTTFSPNFPGWLEGLKNQNLATQTTYDLSHLKMACLQASADASRVNVAQGVAAIETNELDLKRRAARDVLDDPDSDEALRADARKTYRLILNSERPGMVNTNEFVSLLRRYLPGVSGTEIGDPDNVNDPANVVDYIESEEFTNLVNSAGLPGFSGATNVSSAGAGPSGTTGYPGTAGPSSAAGYSGAGPSSATGYSGAGPSSAAGYSGAAGPSNGAGPSSAADPNVQ